MAVINAFVQDAVDLAEPLTLDAAYALAWRAALTDSDIGTVGLEIEAHLVDLESVPDAVAWHRVRPIPDLVRRVVASSRVTLEPGGQVELSGAPQRGIAAAIDKLRHDWQGTRLALAEQGLGVAFCGADPLRPARRTNPRPRYQAMEQHFAAVGRGEPGAVMMNSTAALQVNLQAGPQREWSARVERAHRLGPTLVAIAACSPWLRGEATGWKSVRQATWAQLDRRSCGSVPGCVPQTAAGSGSTDPAMAWAKYAMRAPVIIRRGPGDRVDAVPAPVTFGHWASGLAPLDSRRPTAADLETHLSTLFPPVRMRGYLELRYMDVTAPRWWPAIAAVTATLMDDPVAADAAMEATEQTASRWMQAAQAGLGDELLAASARRCLAVAGARVPVGLRSAVDDLAELVESGSSPGDLLAGRISEVGPLAALEELGHA
jgi:glutamate--cysteine ligase